VAKGLLFLLSPSDAVDPAFAANAIIVLGGPGSAEHREERCTASGTRGENATAAGIAADG